MSRISPIAEGLSCVADADPTGNGVPSVQLMFRDAATGDEYESGIFAKFHGQKIQLYQRAATQGAPVFELDPSNDRVVINQL